MGGGLKLVLEFALSLVWLNYLSAARTGGKWGGGKDFGGKKGGGGGGKGDRKAIRPVPRDAQYHS